MIRRLKKYGVLIICVLAGCPVINAQSVWKNMRSNEELAQYYYESGKYQKALVIYNHILKKDNNDDLALVRSGRINFYLKNYQRSVEQLQQYRLKNTLPQEDLLLYADGLAAIGRYNQAIEVYNSYMQKYGDNDWLSMKVWRLNNLDYLYEDSLVYSIKPTSLNSDFSEYPVAYYNDGLLFVSDRERETGFKQYLDESTGRNTYALYFTQNIQKDKPGTELSTLVKPGGYHIAGLSFMPRYNTFMYAKNVENNKADTEQRQQIFSKTVSLEGEGEKLAFNEGGFDCTHPSISADGKTVYFAAERPEGFGGLDLYVSKNEGGKWSAPQNLGDQINTPGDESFPFIHNSGMLYFSSDGHPGFGGYDLFKVDAKAGNAEVQNMGYPLNENADDFALILNTRGDRGHFATNRSKGGLNDDIYAVEIDLQEYPLTISGVLKFKNLDSGPVLLPNTVYEVVDNRNQKVVFTSQSDEGGRFNIDIPYASQFYIRVQIGQAEPLVVSFDIPKNKDKQANHEIVVVSNRFIPIEQSGNH